MARKDTLNEVKLKEPYNLKTTIKRIAEADDYIVILLQKDEDDPEGGILVETSLPPERLSRILTRGGKVFADISSQPIYQAAQ